MNKYTEELFQLMKENPELPVVPMVDGEIACDDCGYWLGSWRYACVDEYVLCSDRVLFKSDDDVIDVLDHCLTDDEFNQLPDEEDECRKIYDTLPWKKAIVVYIGLPEEEEDD